MTQPKLDFILSFMSIFLDCMCLCGFVHVYASVCRVLTAITSDIKWLFSEGFAPFHVVIASLWWRRGPLLRAAFSHDSCNIYMFTLTISICCFWNNQQQGPGEKHGERLWVALHLGFMIGRLGLIMLGGEEEGVVVFFKAFSRFLTKCWENVRAQGLGMSLA